MLQSSMGKLVFSRAPVYNVENVQTISQLSVNSCTKVSRLASLTCLAKPHSTLASVASRCSLYVA